VAFIFGSIVGIARTLPSKTAERLGFAYVEFFRKHPLVVQLFLWYFVLPELVPTAWGSWLKQLQYAPFYTAVIASASTCRPVSPSRCAPGSPLWPEVSARLLSRSG